MGKTRGLRYLSPISCLCWDRTSHFFISALWIAASSANSFLDFDPSSTVMLSGRPVYTVDRHIGIASHTGSLDTSFKNLAPWKLFASSTMWSTGRLSRFIISTYARALNCTSFWPIDTLKRKSALRIAWKGSQRAITSLRSSCFSLFTDQFRLISKILQLFRTRMS